MSLKNQIESIKKQFDENNNSHVFLIETDNICEATKDIKDIIKHVLKADELTKNQIDDENYIEQIIIRPTNELIVKDDVIRLQTQIRTKSILSDKKFYIIEGADKLNESAANKLLKTIEEPQDGIYGFLIAENISTILPTIKSRCQIESFYYKNSQNEKEYSIDEIDISNKIIEIIETKDFKDLTIYKTCDKTARDIIKTNGKTIANIIKDYYNISGNSQANTKLKEETLKIIRDNNKPNERISKAKYLNTLLNKLNLNMNTELLIDKIVVDLKEVKNDASSWNKI